MSVARYQNYQPAPVYLDLAGVANNPNGYIQFYAIGTTNPKDTYNAFSGGSANSNPVLLDSSGRPNTQVWLDGDYSIVEYDADDVVVDTYDMRPAADPAQSIPIPDPGEFVTGDGSQFLVEEIRQLPDPTGLVGYVPVSDGEGYIMTPLPEAPEAPTLPVENTSGHVKIGTVMFQWGTGTVPAAASAKTSSVNITFAEVFTGTPYIVDPTNTTPGGSTPSGACAVLCSSSESTTGATITANIPDDDSNSNWKLANATTFKYLAVGPCAAP